jgi:phage gp45-like
MNDGAIKQLSARLRNIFSLGDLQKRYEDGKIQVKTVFGRVVEKKEAFPYGFKAKAKKGKVFVLCQGGNFDGFELLPALDYEGGPELQPGDTALYTEAGGFIICRENGAVEVTAKAGKDVTIHTNAGDIICGGNGAIKIKGAAIALQDGGLAAARQTDPVQSTAADDPPFWQWITAVSSAIAALTGGSLTPPTMINSKIMGGSTTVSIG